MADSTKPCLYCTSFTCTLSCVLSVVPIKHGDERDFREKRFILLTPPDYRPVIVGKPRQDLPLVPAHAQLRAEGTECVRAHLLNCAQFYASTLGQFRNPCLGSEWCHSHCAGSCFVS